ncbi:MAG TPA: glycosyltransferase family 4 protein [Ignavibacteria bacterium]
MKISILGIKTLPANAGADRVVENFLENSSNNNQFTIYLSRVDNNQKLKCTDSRIYIYIPTINSKYLKAFIFFLLSSLHFLIKGRCDIAHIHNSDFGLFNILIWFKRKTKIIGTFHGNPYQRDKWNILAKLYLKISEYFFIRFSDFLTTVAESKIQEIPEKYRNKIIYIPNGINADNPLSNNINLNDYGLLAKEYILFACGRLDKTKGLHHLIKAFQVLNLPLKLFVIGDFSHDKNYVLELEKLINNDDNIICYRQLFPKEELNFILKNCRMFVFPSEVEAMSMMLLETIALNVPFVCSDIPENISIVGKDYKYLFENKNSVDLRNVIQLALNDKNILKEIENLYNKVKTRYNWKIISSDYNLLYEKIFKLNI